MRAGAGEGRGRGAELTSQPQQGGCPFLPREGTLGEGPGAGPGAGRREGTARAAPVGMSLLQTASPHRGLSPEFPTPHSGLWEGHYSSALRFPPGLPRPRSYFFVQGIGPIMTFLEARTEAWSRAPTVPLPPQSGSHPDLPGEARLWNFGLRA